MLCLKIEKSEEAGSSKESEPRTPLAFSLSSIFLYLQCEARRSEQDKDCIPRVSWSLLHGPLAFLLHKLSARQ